MPANRSRTSGWRRCLEQICLRHGAIEIAISRSQDRSSETRQESDLVWRVRVLTVTDSEIVVEQAAALGQAIVMEQGLRLVAVLSIGQNRWTFNTTILGSTTHELPGDRSIEAIRLRMPDYVQRCQRRSFYRVSTESINLPAVEIWPLIDPASVVVAERANELQLAEIDGIKGVRSPHEESDGGKVNIGYQRSLSHSNSPGQSPAEGTRNPTIAQSIDPAVSVMPDVGPKFTAVLMNVGGGGIGLLIEPDNAQVLHRHKLFWLRIALPPHLSVPICATGKLVHSHMESSQHVYAGMAFDFTFNPSHQRFVVDQIRRYVAVQQREQFDRQQELGNSPQRKSA